MKKFLVIALGLAFACGASADGDWRDTLGKVKDLSGDTGVSGFLRKEAPAYITGNFAEKDRPAAPDFTKPLANPAAYANKNGFWVTSEAQAAQLFTAKHAVKKGDWIGGYFDDSGAFVPGHTVSVLGGLPYGIGQLIMIPLCLVMIYLAIVKGFEPLLLLPIGFGGLLANCPLGGVTAPAMMHDGLISFLASGLPVMQGGIVEPGGFLY